MGKAAAAADAVVDAGVVDETTGDETGAGAEDEGAETVGGGDRAGAAGTEGAEGAEGADAGAEEPDAGAEDAGAAEPSAKELAAEHRIAALESQIAALTSARTIAEPAPAPKTVSHIQSFVQRAAPEFRKAFTAVSPVTVHEDGTVTANAEGVAQQYDTIYLMTDQMVGAVLADRVEPFNDHMATRVIQLENELEVRDLRAHKETGALFVTLEPAIRKELKALPWKDRVTEGAVTRIFHRLLGERNGGDQRPAPVAGQPRASAALKDISAGSRTQTGKPVLGVKLTPVQESDYQAMLEEGVTLSRERYAARYKARADKFRAEKKSAPKTLRSFR